MNQFDLVRLINPPNRAASHLEGAIGVVAAFNDENDYIRSSIPGRIDVVTRIDDVRRIPMPDDDDEFIPQNIRSALWLRRKMIETKEKKERETD